MTLHGAQKVENEELRLEGNLLEEPAGLFDPTVLENLAPALPDIARKGFKAAVNAGACDTQLLAKVVADEIARQNLNLKVAYVEGDTKINKFVSFITGENLKDCGYTLKRLQCYLGGASIAEALNNGADIVFCGRVAKAAPSVGVGLWWHGWNREKDFDQIAGSLICGHLIESCPEGVVMAEEGKPLVRVTGVRGLPHPPLRKTWIERQVRYSAGDAIKELSSFKFSVNGYRPDVTRNQNVATCDVRIFFQTKNKKLVDKSTLHVPGFNRRCMDNGLQGYPGWTLGIDQRQSEGKVNYEYTVSLFPQSEVQHHVVLPWLENKTIDILPPKDMKLYPRQSNYEIKDVVDLRTFGPTTRGAMGWVVGCHSGGNASDANVDFYVRNDDEWGWLRSFLTIRKTKLMLDEEDHLDRGFNSTSTYDTLGKNFGEYLRAKWVDTLNRFLERGRF
ncbi:uncharacterized protein CC84DRAFT_1198468 [Paraphaeosphaeria sporulosa]|uniref:Acyclic terpene utilisation N-terminal domain-containing protein n=1 Tax=Paraphaeosphaeria sporulosa TaxID=1460663 RepID=A0A177C5W6_9PLEO|nr:uncharacterized protein CC84DRAFT_1198468 [Paraphaeosphaeria sporulosa]OAG02272.1 hypothetical protein CC84DRAFT_1198468 [Paraphaeosphaeria sporulosa]